VERSRGAVPEWLSRSDLDAVFQDKYGQADAIGWNPARRQRAGYYLPADLFEATVARYVTPGCAWLDVGGGRQIFPENPILASRLVARSGAVVAVDPDPNVLENPFVHERHQVLLEDFQSDQKFDLATLRMVVEHVEHPERFVRSLRRLMKPGGTVIVFTVDKWAPLSMLSALTPFRLHHPLKRFFWGGEERDTFPVQYRMNTRTDLRNMFVQEGFRESAFVFLDDLSTFAAFRVLGALELRLWSAWRRLGRPYPERCLLGVYTALP
jgi:2-polyprenyl-3-methyl-5-hydroxy-6-metoxy-1,4-benzoquinol methylase